MKQDSDLTAGTLKIVGAALTSVFVVVGAYAYWLPNVHSLRRQNPMTTRYVKIYVDRIRKSGNRPAVAMRWTALDDISPYLRRAVLMAEDDRFYHHRGVDWVEFKKAMRYNWKKKEMARGASTISQQVARNLFLSPSRRARRKFKEILIARHLERSLGKRRILEIYLNIVEWGEGVFGAQAASRVYFGKNAKDLTPEEAVALAAALPSPYRYNPSHPPDERTQAVRRHYLERMAKEGLLSVSR